MFSKEKNLEILYEVLDIYTKETAQTLAVPPELENYQFSGQFERNMQCLIKMQRRSCYKYINTVGKRIACYILIILTCMFVTVFSVKSLREPFVNFVVKTYEKFTSLFVEKDVPTDNIEFEVMLPQYIPEGYEEQEQTRDLTLYTVTYINSDNQYFVFSQNIDRNWLATVDSENTTYELIYINSLEGVYSENKGINCLIFGNERYTFKISGYISKDEILKIAGSIDIK